MIGKQQSPPSKPKCIVLHSSSQISSPTIRGLHNKVILLAVVVLVVVDIVVDTIGVIVVGVAINVSLLIILFSSHRD